MLDYGDQSHLGHQDQAYVSVKLENSNQPFKSSLALQKYLGCSKGYVPHGRPVIFLFGSYASFTWTDSRCNTISSVRSLQGEVYRHWKRAKGNRRGPEPPLLRLGHGRLLE